MFLYNPPERCLIGGVVISSELLPHEELKIYHQKREFEDVFIGSTRPTYLLQYALNIIPNQTHYFNSKQRAH